MLEDDDITIDPGEEEAPEPEPEKAETEKAEAEPPPEPEKPRVEFTPEQQEVMERELGRKVAKQREAERAAEEAQRKADALEAKLAELSKVERPVIPPPPEPYDDDYQDKLKERDDALVKAAQYDHEQRMVQQRQQQEEFQKQQAAQEALNTKITTYAERADKLGIDKPALQVAGNTVGQAQLNPDIFDYILQSEQGPNITLYLSKNPTELDAMRNMSPMQAAVHISTQITPKATASREPPTLTPDPVENPSGAGFSEGDGGLQGATYE